MADGGAPLPVTVLTGFLGAGKTTLLVKLLGGAPDARAAVILNEIGVAGTEELDVKQATLELTQGCVCCVRADDLVAALEGLRGRDDVERVIVETTGIADPLALTFVLERPDLEPICRLDGVITVVDGLGWEKTRVAEWESQVRAADLVVVSKVDLAGEAALVPLAAAVAELNPAARLLRAGEADAQVVLDVERGPRPGGVDPAAAPAHSGFNAVSIAGDARYDADRLEDWLESLPPEVYRAKGLARVGDERWMAFHVVGGRAQVDLEARAPAHGQSRMVFIGRGVDEAALKRELESSRT
jgi:G3E family GTPase